MNILATVGTTPFDQLIAAVDQQFSNVDFSITCQISSGNYQPHSHAFVRFVENYSDLFSDVDIVITHGGAATVFELLEAGKKIVLVPNLLRIDKHQEDLAHFVEKNQYGVVCRQLDTLVSCVERASRTTFKQYQKEPFFMGRSILQYFGIPTK
jgi:beta-1,4-N-acetylglucosaminyltransferase